MQCRLRQNSEGSSGCIPPAPACIVFKRKKNKQTNKTRKIKRIRPTRNQCGHVHQYGAGDGAGGGAEGGALIVQELVQEMVH